MAEASRTRGPRIPSSLPRAVIPVMPVAVFGGLPVPAGGRALGDREVTRAKKISSAQPLGRRAFPSAHTLKSDDFSHWKFPASSTHIIAFTTHDYHKQTSFCGPELSFPFRSPGSSLPLKQLHWLLNGSLGPASRTG